MAVGAGWERGECRSNKLPWGQVRKRGGGENGRGEARGRGVIH